MSEFVPPKPLRNSRGEIRRVGVEIDRGNLKLGTFRDRDECDAIVTVQGDGTHVQANVGGSQSYLFNEDGVGFASSSPTPSFAEGR